MKLSVIIPALNEAENVKGLVDELTDLFNKDSRISDHQILFIDDHSTDQTFETVKNLNNPHVNCYRLSKSSGSHTAIRAGLHHIDGDAVLCISADGQDNPQVIGEMLDKWADGAKVVWGLRKNRDSEPWYIRKPADWFYRILIALGGKANSSIDLPRADFYLLDRIAVKAINRYTERKTSLFGLIIWTGFRQDYVEYDRRARQHGKSSWNLKSRLSLARDWIVAFSGVPIKLVTLMGTIVASVGFLYALVVVFNVFLRHPVEGWSSLIVIVLILGGFQMIMLGVIGEYLWQNLEESRKRPLYFEEQKTHDTSKE